MATNKKPLQQRAIKTRSSIIEDAFNCFKIYGYKKTNTILIAKEAGVSIGIVYSYFANKDELLTLWLDSLVERSDNYFYNQLKLLEYNVEFSLIVSNILEKINDSFFCSPIVLEKDNDELCKILEDFYTRVSRIFYKCLSDSSIIVKNQNETTHIVINTILNYNFDIKNQNLNYNLDVLKDKYVKIIVSLLKN